MSEAKQLPTSASRLHCLVTGANGFIGSHLIPRLLKDGHRVTVMLRPGSDVSSIRQHLSSLHVVYGSLQELRNLESALRSETLDVAVHLAWQGVTAEFRNDGDQISKNVVGTLALWNAVKQYGCRTWIGLGSQAEYGLCSGILREDQPADPVTSYGAGKLAAAVATRQLCRLSGMRFVWFRLLSTYGPNDDARHMLPMLITTLLDGKKPAVTRGEQIWDYLYIEDVVNALCAAVSGSMDGIFNLGSGSACPLRRVIECVRDLVDPTLPIGFGDVPYRPDQVMHLEGDISRLLSAGNWRPAISLEEGLKRTVEWHRAKRNRAATN